MAQETTYGRICTEIENIRQRYLAQDAEVYPHWVAQEICEDHKAGFADNEDGEIARDCMYQMVRAWTTKVIRKERKASNGDRELFPGYEHLCKSYVIKRHAQWVEVPLDCMSDAEIDAYIEVLEGQAQACYRHKSELLRYKRIRAGQLKGA